MTMGRGTAGASAAAATDISRTALWLGAAAGLWAVLVILGLATRPLLAVDETRYVGVAWEMWRRGDFLVPYLNGEPYSHKPPLMFWLMTAGWTVFGVTAWWARLVAPLFGLGALFLIAALARLLWPCHRETARTAPLILLALPPWTLFTTLTMFDGMVAFCALLGLVGVALAWRGSIVVGWLLFGLGFGFGVLAKGPVIAVFLLPVAVAAPWWADGPGSEGRRDGGWPAWYLGLLLGAAFGIGLALAWALPAAEAGGERYANAILWGQTADRVVSSFAHRRPAWWFVAVLPAALLPWTAWPALWRGLARLRAGADAGVRFCGVWFVAALAVMSLVSGKQVHYLLPVLPAVALILGRVVTNAVTADDRRDALFPAAIVVALGLALGLIPLVAGRLTGLPPWVAEVSPLLGLGLAVSGFVLALVRPDGIGARFALMAAQPIVFVALIHVAIMPAAGPYYGLAEAARVVGEAQEAGMPVAYVGHYHGQFQFYGRLRDPVEAIEPGDVRSWLARNPDGVIVALHRRQAPPAGDGALFVRPFRGRVMAIWTHAAAAANPEMFR